MSAGGEKYFVPGTQDEVEASVFGDGKEAETLAQCLTSTKHSTGKSEAWTAQHPRDTTAVTGSQEATS